jgi:branched-chain amino acid transport system substrate-binding protein
VAIFTDKTAPYSVGYADNFKTAFTKMGGQVVMEQSYSGGDKDFRGALTAIKAANPQAILVPGYYADAGSIAKQARDLGITVPLLGGDGWDSPALFDTGGDAVNGCYFTDHMSVDDPKDAVQNFVKAYHAKYGADNKPDALTALAYDAASLLFDAMKRAPTLTGKEIRDAIAQTKDFPGVTGTITIDANRNASKPAVVLMIKDRKFTKVAEIANPEQPMK